MKWEEIDPFNKGKLIKKYMKAGFKSLDAMKKHYNEVVSKPAKEDYIEENEPIELPDFKNQTYDADEGWREIIRNTNKYANGGHLYKEGGEKEKPYAASTNGTTDLEALADKYTITAEKPWYADYQEVLPYKTLMEASKFKDKDRRKQYLDEQVYRRKTGKSQYMQDLNKIAYGLDNLAIGSLASGVTAPVAYAAGTTVLPALATPLSTAVNIGSKMLPSLSKVAPYAAVGDGAIDLGLTIDGIRNAFTDNGIQKTIRLAKEGDTWGTLKSGAGDVLDLSGILGVTNKIHNTYNYLNSSLGYYGDNILSRFYNTVARKYNLPNKAYLPELIRRGHIPEVDSNKNIILGNPDHVQTNFTTNASFTPHKHYRYSSIGSEPVIIVNPAKIDYSKAFSIEPSDTFFLGEELKSMNLKPKDITVISGKPEELSLAKDRGFNIKTSKKLQQLVQDSKLKDKTILSKDGDLIDPREYRYALQEVIDKRGNPTLDDYLLLRNKAGLPIKIEPLHKQQATASKFLEYYSSLDHANLNDMEILIPEILRKEPRHINWEPEYDYNHIIHKQHEILDTPYRKVFYDPTSSVEADFVTRYNLNRKDTSKESIQKWKQARKEEKERLKNKSSLNTK